MNPKNPNNPKEKLESLEQENARLKRAVWELVGGDNLYDSDEPDDDEDADPDDE